MAAQLHDKIEKQATGEISTKANAFLERMKDARANRKFIEAGSAGLDVMIELDGTPSCQRAGADRKGEAPRFAGFP